LKDRVTGVLNARKSRVSEGLETVAEAVRRVGEPLHDEPFSKLGGYADNAARTIERVATRLRERELDELTEDLRGFARKRPAVFVGAGLAAGLVAARFLKSSGERSEPRRPERVRGRREDEAPQQTAAGQGKGTGSRRSV
jgi:hypothetical protein